MTIRDMYRELFGGKCPYTGKPCDSWVCAECKVEKEEVEWMKKLDESEDDHGNTTETTKMSEVRT